MELQLNQIYSKHCITAASTSILVRSNINFKNYLGEVTSYDSHVMNQLEFLNINLKKGSSLGLLFFSYVKCTYNYIFHDNN